MPFSLKLFQKHVVPFASPTGRFFFFYYLEVVVFMNWDKYLVGRSFISWSFQFEFHYFILGMEYIGNVVSPFKVVDRTIASIRNSPQLLETEA